MKFADFFPFSFFICFFFGYVESRDTLNYQSHYVILLFLCDMDVMRIPISRCIGIGDRVFVFIEAVIETVCDTLIFNTSAVIEILPPITLTTCDYIEVSLFKNVEITWIRDKSKGLLHV